MIKNERQYRITKAQKKKLELTLDGLNKAIFQPSDIDPIILKAQKEAIGSQLIDLDGEIIEYEKLKTGGVKSITINSFEDLPSVLIKARIAKGLSQRELANKLGVKEQQIQRYESTGYNSASLGRIMEVINLLNIKISKSIDLSEKALSMSLILKRARKAGIDPEFLKRRIIPSHLRNNLHNKATSKETYQVAHLIENIFGWSITDLKENTSPNFYDVVLARFKMPAKINRKNITAYTIYTHYMALLVLKITEKIIYKEIPTNHKQFRLAILNEFGEFNYNNVIRYAWNLGVPVLPLRDNAAFHGACWRIEGRNVIILKQTMMLESRWLFDLLHELYHASQHANISDYGMIEAKDLSKEQRMSAEEQSASIFAGDVILDGRAEQLAELCVKEATGKVEYLKKVLPTIAKSEGVNVGDLANYLAYRLSLQEINWWGTAYNLQKDHIDDSPWEIARNHFIQNTEIDRLNEMEQTILLQALEEV